MKVGVGRGLRVAVVVCSLGSAGALASCFPGYGIGSGGAGDGGLDGTVGDAKGPDATGGDGSTGDGSAGGDGTAPESSAGDAPTAEGGSPESSVQDVTLPPWDGSLLPTEVVVEGGTFSFQVLDWDGGVVNAQAKLDYDFAVNRTEVTVARFQGFLDAGMAIPAGGTVLDPRYPTAMKWDTGWNVNAADTSYASASCNSPAPASFGPTYGAGPSIPMNCVTWEQAQLFCVWDHGRRLMTDTEWRVLASKAGGGYPWGSASPSCSRAIYSPTSADCGWPVPAGSTDAGVTPDGLYDIAGSLSEWVWDWLPDYYLYPGNPTTDYAGPAPGTGNNSRLWIGGSFWEDTTQLESRQSEPSYVIGSGGGSGNYNAIGFRCVRSLD